MLKLDCIVIKKLSLFVKENNSIKNNKLIQLLRLGGDFYKCFCGIFDIFTLYNYINSIFKVRLDICDKNTYNRKKLKYKYSNFIMHTHVQGTHLVNTEFSIFLYIYSLYPMIHINLFEYDNILYNMNNKKIKIVNLFYYIENDNTIKIIFYSKREDKFLIETVKILENNIDILTHELNEEMDNTTYYNKISNNLLLFKDIFIYLKNINNE